jgi:catechol 2,3-dioxygenase-like lactoylglutathione lyase family enzyme
MTLFPSPVPPPTEGAQAPGISREIYGMPAFITLAVTDVAATVDWYTEALGFIVLFSVPGLGDSPVLVHLRRWQFQDILVRPSTTPVAPGDAAFFSVAAVYGELDALADRARAHGAGRVEGPTDTPWNTRDLRTTDPDGNVLVFTAGRPPEHSDQDFSDRMTTWSADQDLG